ncbi:hypothetical protein BH11PSE8_BH11PSE8_09390 [soil metagenome]
MAALFERSVEDAAATLWIRSITPLYTMRRCIALVLATLLGALSALPAAAQWKWMDKNRQVQYSDLPPPLGTPEQDILQRPASARRAAAPAVLPASAAASGSALSPKGVDSELEAKRRQTEQEQAAKKQAQDDAANAAKAQNCTRARDALRALESGVRMSMVNKQGEREFMDDASRAAETRRAREVAASDCK